MGHKLEKNMLIILIIGAVVLIGIYVVLLNGVNALHGQTQQKRKWSVGSQGAVGGLSPAARSDGPALPPGPVQPPFSMPPPPATGPVAHPSSAASAGASGAAFAS